MSQVNKSNYKFERYVLPDRWLSYYWQIRHAVAENENEEVFASYLIIGAGDKIVPAVIKQILTNIDPTREVSVDTFDFAEDLHPTWFGDIRNINRIIDRKYDCVICCQVLEHLEWKYFERILRSLKEICDGRIVLSLPLYRYPFSVRVETLWFDKSLRFIIEKFWHRSVPWNGQHYWEVGIKGRRRKDILKLLNKYFYVEKDYVAYGNSYHWFAILRIENK